MEGKRLLKTSSATWDQVVARSSSKTPYNDYKSLLANADAEKRRLMDWLWTHRGELVGLAEKAQEPAPQEDNAQEQGDGTVTLPKRIIVDQNGHYWRDFGDSISMCPTTDANETTEVTAEYRLVEPAEPPLPSGGMELQRYYMDEGSSIESPSMKPYKYGEWVKTDDAIALVRSLKQEVEGLRGEVDEWKKCAVENVIPLEALIAADKLCRPMVGALSQTMTVHINKRSDQTRAKLQGGS